jgi:hypothetical protein
MHVSAGVVALDEIEQVLAELNVIGPFERLRCALQPPLARLCIPAALRCERQQRADETLLLGGQRRELRHDRRAPRVGLGLEQRDGVCVALLLCEQGLNPVEEPAPLGIVVCALPVISASRCSIAQRRSALMPRAATWSSSVPRMAWFGE